MNKLIFLAAVTAGLSGSAVAQDTGRQPAADNPPQGRGAAVTPGNRDPGAEVVVVPPDNPGSTAVDSSAVSGPNTSNQASDRTTSREWQGLGSTGGGTGTGTSSGTSADEVAPGQDGNLPAAGREQDESRTVPGKGMQLERMNPEQSHPDRTIPERK